MFAIDCKFEHGELYRRFVANKQIMKQRYRMHTEYVKVRQFDVDDIRVKVTFSLLSTTSVTHIDVIIIM